MNYLLDYELDFLSKFLLDHYYSISRLKKLHVSVFCFNLRNIKMISVLKGVMALDNFCSQKPSSYTYNLVFSFKKNKIDFLSKVTLRGYKMYEYLFLYKYLLFSEFVNNHFKQKKFCNSFKFKKLILIPYMDDAYYKTSFYIRTQFFLSGVDYQQTLVKYSVIL